MSHTVENPTALIARVRRLRGQIDGVERALEAGASCSTVLQQVAAARGAINGLLDKIVEDHLVEHVARPGLTDGERADAAAELLTVIRRYSR